MRISKCIAVVLTLFVALFPGMRPAVAQQENEISFSTPINRASPRDTYQSFLNATARLEEHYANYVADKSYDKIRRMRQDMERIRRLFDLSGVAPSARAKVGNAAIGYLYDVLGRLPTVDAESIPGPGSALTSQSLNAGAASGEEAAASTVLWNVPDTDIQISLIESGQNRGAYLFSAETVANLASYYNDVKDYPVVQPRIYDSFHEEQINASGALIPDSWVANLPEFFKDTYYETPLWKIILVVAVMSLCGLAALLWVWYAYHRPHHRMLWRISVPLVILLLLSAGEWLIAHQINPAGIFAASELMLLTGARYVCAAWLSWLMVFWGAEFFLNSKRAQAASYDQSLIRLITRVVAIVLFAGILATGADELGIPALGLVAGLGVGGLAIALAAQPTLENLFAGVSLFADRPFRIGDSIVLDGEVAEIERIGTRSSRLRLRDGTLCTTPNSDLATISIVNKSDRKACFLDQTFSIKSDCSAQQVGTLLRSLRAMLAENELVEKKEGWPRAYFSGTHPGRLDVRVQANFLTPFYHIFLAEQEAFLLKALEAMEANGIEMAQPLPLGPQGVATARVE